MTDFVWRSKMKIGLFTDPHYSDKVEPSCDRYHSLSYDKIYEAMTYFKNEGVELVVCLGDLTDDCINIEDNPKALKRISDMINSFGIKFYSLMGNHDCLSFTREEFNGLSNGAYPPFKIENENCALIFLDCNYNDNGEPYKVRNIDWKNCFLPNEQFDKLKETLKNRKKKYIFVHQNLDKDVDKHHIVHNAEEIRRELEKAENVKMVIQGHYHKGHENIINGINYHTLPSMCTDKKNYYEILEI